MLVFFIYFSPVHRFSSLECSFVSHVWSLKENMYILLYLHSQEQNHVSPTEAHRSRLVYLPNLLRRENVSERSERHQVNVFCNPMESKYLKTSPPPLIFNLPRVHTHAHTHKHIYTYTQYIQIHNKPQQVEHGATQ